jgi:hypothetical protein
MALTCPTPPVVFAGLSLALEEVRGSLHADVRPPVKAGDLDELGPGSTVAIIDGELDAVALIPSDEIRRALARGIAVHGAASVGAMRAAEPAADGMQGIGWVYGAFLSGRIRDSDEIAVLYDPVGLHPLSVPLVSIRYRLEHLVAYGEISPAMAHEALIAARALPPEERTPETTDRQLSDIVGMGWLQSAAIRDNKARDARRLLRTFSTGE